MSWPYMLLAAVVWLATLAYGWACARPASRFGPTSAWVGAVALALALSTLSTVMLYAQGMRELPFRYLLMVYAWSHWMPVLAVTAAAIAVRSAALPSAVRGTILAVVLAIAAGVGQHYAARYDFITATA